MNEPVWDRENARILLDATVRMGQLFGEAKTPPMPHAALAALRDRDPFVDCSSEPVA